LGHAGEAPDTGAGERARFFAGADVSEAWDHAAASFIRGANNSAPALTGFVPVSLAPDTPALPAPMSVPVEPQSAAHTAGNVEVEFPNGIKLRLTGDIDARALRQVLAALR
jgi:hypothetical protein